MLEDSGMATTLEPVNDGANTIIELGDPYQVSVTLKGTCPILFHRWDIESVEEKAKSHKNSKAKKTDDVESYVYRCENGNIGISGECLKGALVSTGRRYADPSSPRKSMMDLIKGAIHPITIVADTGAKTWDYIDRHRVVIQRASVTRARPALLAGWTATFVLMCLQPEYVSEEFLLELITRAGVISGLHDFRPTYGRFAVVHYERVSLPQLWTG